MNRGFQNVLIRDIPIVVWGFGILMTAGGVFAAVYFSEIWLGIGFAVYGLATFFRAKTFVVARNLNSNHLIIRHAGILQRTVQEFPVREIQSIDVRPVKYQPRRRKKTYEVVIIRENGDKIQLRKGLPVDMSRIAKRLRKELGIVG
jgi:hypothetical protein